MWDLWSRQAVTVEGEPYGGAWEEGGTEHQLLHQLGSSPGPTVSQLGGLGQATNFWNMEIKLLLSCSCDKMGLM